ncbi:MAG: hypothetical protein KAH23_10460 [Kiritimatiellae bacterium]|nr:hypothetical protein [Kiritimatiellia bacterium]
MRTISEQVISTFLMAVIAITALGSNHLFCIDANGHVSLDFNNASGECGANTSNSISEEECCHQCVNIPIHAAIHKGYMTKAKNPVTSRGSVLALSFNSYSFLSPKAPPSVNRSTSYLTGLALRPAAPLVLRI